MQNFSNIKVTITVWLHSKTEIMSIFPPIERCCLLSFCHSRIPFFHTKHKTKLKHKQNVTLYNPHDLNDTYQLKCLTRELALVMHKQHSIATVNLVTLYFKLTLLLLSMYHVIAITSFFPKLILQYYVANAMLGVSWLRI